MSDTWYAVRSLDALKPDAIYTVYEGEPVDAARYAAVTRDNDVLAPTPEELEEEERYYAYLNNLAAPVMVDDDDTDDQDDDDHGYCGPTCGRFGNW